jgi:shikimate dehydrogenase
MLLVGAGGAGSAIAYEAARAGVARLVIRDIDKDRAAALCAAVARVFPACMATPVVPPGFRFDILCNATPLGMGGEAEHPWPLGDCHPGSLVIDVVPTPAMTPWLSAAASRGLRVQTGPEMVKGQFRHVCAHLLGIAPADVPAARE